MLTQQHSSEVSTCILCQNIAQRWLFPFKENIYITGNLDVLQNWSPDNALILDATNYPIWNSKYTENHAARILTDFYPTVTLTLPADTVFEYKYIRKFDGVVTWESDPNNAQTTPGSGPYVINDVWR